MADTDRGTAWTLRGEDGPKVDESFHSSENSCLIEEPLLLVYSPDYLAKALKTVLTNCCLKISHISRHFASVRDHIKDLG